MKVHKEPVSRFFFPLRTNVEYFASPTGFLTLERRMKQAALLHDIVICEGGMYVATVGHAGSVDLWIPPADITDDGLRHPLEPTGGEYYFALTPSGTKQRHVIQSGPVERRFRSEFHTILKSVGSQIPDWIKIETYDLTQPAKDLANWLTEQDIRNPAITIPEGGSWLRRKIISNLNRDLVLVRSLQCVASIDPLHMPILREKTSGSQSALGFLSLEVAIPDFSQLSWDHIAEIREHKAMTQFRRKMREVEDLARAALPHADYEELTREISRLLDRELLNEVKNLLPKTASTARSVVVNLVSSLLPFPVSTVAAVATSIVDISEQMRIHNSWVTVFMKLRDIKSQR